MICPFSKEFAKNFVHLHKKNACIDLYRYTHSFFCAKFSISIFLVIEIYKKYDIIKENARL